MWAAVSSGLRPHDLFMHTVYTVDSKFVEDGRSVVA